MSMVAASAPRGSRRSIDRSMPVQLDDWMACEQRIAEASVNGLLSWSCRPQRARVVIECFEEDRLPRFDG